MIRNFKDNPAPEDANPRGCSQAMKLMAKMVSGGDLPIDELEKCVRFAAEIRDNPNARDRERINAGKLILAVARQSLDAAAMVEKFDRLDSGEATERVDHTFSERPTEESLSEWRDRHLPGSGGE